MNAFKKTLVAIAAAATLGATALASTQAFAWCGDRGYVAFDYSPYGYDDSYGRYDRHDRYEHRDYDHHGYHESHRRF